MIESIPSSQVHVVGALACQRDSYLRTIEAEVVSCVKFSPPKVKQSNGQKKKQAAANSSTIDHVDSWLVEFSDSVLFPEGIFINSLSLYLG